MHTQGVSLCGRRGQSLQAGVRGANYDGNLGVYEDERPPTAPEPLSCCLGSGLSRVPGPPAPFLLSDSYSRQSLGDSCPPHRPINAKLQPAGSKTYLLSRESTESLSRLQIEMPGTPGKGRLPHLGRWELEAKALGADPVPGKTIEAGLSGLALALPQSPVIRRLLWAACLPPPPHRRCLRSQGCLPGLEHSLCRTL